MNERAAVGLAGKDLLADACECHACEDKRTAHLSAWGRTLARKFIVCATCGNKRCPRASDHELACTGSNASGQPGSRY